MDGEEDLLKASALVELALQGVASKDARLLERVLSVADVSLIKACVGGLPRSLVLLGLLDAIVERLQRTPSRASILVPWVSSILKIHASFFVKCGLKETSSRLKPLTRIVESRTKNLKRLLMLKGRIDLVLGAAQQPSKLPKGADIQALMEQPGLIFDDQVEDDSLPSTTDLNVDEELEDSEVSDEASDLSISDASEDEETLDYDDDSDDDE